MAQATLNPLAKITTTAKMLVVEMMIEDLVDDALRAFNFLNLVFENPRHLSTPDFSSTGFQYEKAVGLHRAGKEDANQNE